MRCIEQDVLFEGKERERSKERLVPCLKTRRQAIEQMIMDKRERLRQLCLREAVSEGITSAAVG